MSSPNGTDRGNQPPGRGTARRIPNEYSHFIPERPSQMLYQDERGLAVLPPQREETITITAAAAGAVQHAPSAHGVSATTNTAAGPVTNAFAAHAHGGSEDGVFDLEFGSDDEPQSDEEAPHVIGIVSQTVNGIGSAASSANVDDGVGLYTENNGHGVLDVQASNSMAPVSGHEPVSSTALQGQNVIEGQYASYFDDDSDLYTDDVPVATSGTNAAGVHGNVANAAHEESLRLAEFDDDGAVFHASSGPGDLEVADPHGVRLQQSIDVSPPSPVSSAQTNVMPSHQELVSDDNISEFSLHDGESLLNPDLENFQSNVRDAIAGSQPLRLLAEVEVVLPNHGSAFPLPPRLSPSASSLAIRELVRSNSVEEQAETPPYQSANNDEALTGPAQADRPQTGNHLQFPGNLSRLAATFPTHAPSDPIGGLRSFPSRSGLNTLARPPPAGHHAPHLQPQIPQIPDGAQVYVNPAYPNALTLPAAATPTASTAPREFASTVRGQFFVGPEEPGEQQAHVDEPPRGPLDHFLTAGVEATAVEDPVDAVTTRLQEVESGGLRNEEGEVGVEYDGERGFRADDSGQYDGAGNGDLTIDPLETSTPRSRTPQRGQEFVPYTQPTRPPRVLGTSLEDQRVNPPRFRPVRNADGTDPYHVPPSPQGLWSRLSAWLPKQKKSVRGQIGAPTNPLQTFKDAPPEPIGSRMALQDLPEQPAPAPKAPNAFVQRLKACFCCGCCGCCHKKADQEDDVDHAAQLAGTFAQSSRASSINSVRESEYEDQVEEPEIPHEHMSRFADSYHQGPYPQMGGPSNHRGDYDVYGLAI